MTSHAHDATGGAGAEEQGILLTNAHGYNVLLALVFGGRRGALDAAIVRASGAGPGARVLDVGSGPGHLARRFAEAVGPEGQVVGADPSPGMVAYAGRRAERLEHCRFVLAPAQDLGLPDSTFDVVTSTFALHHIPEHMRPRAMSEMYRVLRPGGRLLLADTFPTGLVTPAITRLLARMARRRHGAEADSEPMADTDVTQHAGTLLEIGFNQPVYTDVKPWTRYLITTKPTE